MLWRVLWQPGSLSHEKKREKKGGEGQSEISIIVSLGMG